VRPMEDGEVTAFRYRDYLFLRDNNSTLAGLSGSGMFRMVEEHGQDEIANPAEANPVTGNYFDTLGVKAAFGRTLTPGDDSSNGSHVAVASHRFAVARFGEPYTAIGKTIFLKNVAFTIVGVLQPSFTGISKGSRRGDLYVPISTMLDAYERDLPPGAIAD